MPELPEVQTVVNDLRADGLEGLQISEAEVFWPRTVREMSPAAFSAAIRGRTVLGLSRRAKWIVMELSGAATLLVHLRMSGRLNFSFPDVERNKHEHVILSLSDGRQLRFHDTRKFGRMQLSDSPEEVLGALGPEPLERTFSVKRLAAILAASRRALKPLLLDQNVIAGIGNIYADEALWEARLHPERSGASLQAAETAALHKAIRLVLQRGLRNLGTSFGEGKTTFYSVAKRRGRNKDALQVFRRTGEPCPRCGSTIERLLVGQRSTHICPACQRK